MRESAGKDTSRMDGRYVRNSRARAVYDPGAHKEFVTGFRRRKQARRAQASKDIAAADKKSRRDARKERRRVLRRTADRARGFVTSSDDDHSDDGDTTAEGTGPPKDDREKVGIEICGRGTRVYDGVEESVVTTTVTPIPTFADSHFYSRLPLRRDSASITQRQSGIKLRTGSAISELSACSTHTLAHEGTPKLLQSVGTSVRNGRRLTHSGAKKLSKSNRHSKIAKIRRNRRRGGAG